VDINAILLRGRKDLFFISIGFSHES